MQFSFFPSHVCLEFYFILSCLPFLSFFSFDVSQYRCFCPKRALGDKDAYRWTSDENKLSLLSDALLFALYAKSPIQALFLHCTRHNHLQTIRVLQSSNKAQRVEFIILSEIMSCEHDSTRNAGFVMWSCYISPLWRHSRTRYYKDRAFWQLTYLFFFWQYS